MSREGEHEIDMNQYLINDLWFTRMMQWANLKHFHKKDPMQLKRDIVSMMAKNMAMCFYGPSLINENDEELVAF